MGRKVLVPTEAVLATLSAARLAADMLGVPTPAIRAGAVQLRLRRA
jgi:isocitrate lyase